MPRCLGTLPTWPRAGRVVAYSISRRFATKASLSTRLQLAAPPPKSTDRGPIKVAVVRLRHYRRGPVVHYTNNMSHFVNYIYCCIMGTHKTYVGQMARDRTVTDAKIQVQSSSHALIKCGLSDHGDIRINGSALCEVLHSYSRITDYSANMSLAFGVGT